MNKGEGWEEGGNGLHLVRESYGKERGGIFTSKKLGNAARKQRDELGSRVSAMGPHTSERVGDKERRLDACRICVVRRNVQVGEARLAS